MPSFPALVELGRGGAGPELVEDLEFRQREQPPASSRPTRYSTSASGAMRGEGLGYEHDAGVLAAAAMPRSWAANAGRCGDRTELVSEARREAQGSA